MARRRKTSCAPVMEVLFRSDPELLHLHLQHEREGFRLSGARTWKRQDGTFTARVVWRRREGCKTTSLVYSAHFVPARSS